MRSFMPAYNLIGFDPWVRTLRAELPEGQIFHDANTVVVSHLILSQPIAWGSFIFPVELSLRSLGRMFTCLGGNDLVLPSGRVTFVTPQAQIFAFELLSLALIFGGWQ